MGQSVVVFAWNGKDKPFHHIHYNEVPQFNVVLFNYSGNGAVPETYEDIRYDELINIQTEFKGSLINEVYKHFSANKAIDYIGFIDDDLAISIGGINQLFNIAHEENLDAFQPATTADSFMSHEFTLQKPNIIWEPTDWVEIMCPFYRKTIFDASAEFYPNCISSYGIDRYAIPYFQKILGQDKTAIIHAVPVTHLKPITNGNRSFSNGLSAIEEGELIRKTLLRRIFKSDKQLFSTAFLKNVFEYRTFRWEKWRWDLKRFIGYKS
ncbi:MAG: hypothetical protein Q8K64_11395 [Sediminibacterium sp.]|nr:hypothetical protein [Sediminibacterium sp.]